MGEKRESFNLLDKVVIEASEIALFAFIAGCFWGWLYVRHPTLIGVSLSHILFGILAFFIAGPLGIG